MKGIIIMERLYLFFNCLCLELSILTMFSPCQQSVGDERWGDWRPHLAMILSNQTSRDDLDRKSISTLGDTLGEGNVVN